MFEPAFSTSQPGHAVFIKTLVTTELQAAVAKAFISVVNTLRIQIHQPRS